MGHSLNILPSNGQQLSLDSSALLQVRQPLSNTPGNAQPRTMASEDSCCETKHLAQADNPNYLIPASQLQPPVQQLETTFDRQRQSIRRRRQHKHSRNPIIHSPQYQDYRARQGRSGNHEDGKWPEILEIAFLDALVDIPAMGRRKFSFKGKPHGRNELIKEYIWIAYVQSLAPGQVPDPCMARDRKQVSSHIQVLKAFLKDHPSFDRLFPSNKAPKNGFEESFKNDPCLRALSKGRLPTTRYEQFNDLRELSPKLQPASLRPVIRPTTFWLLVTPTQIQEDFGDLYENDTVIHRYSRLSSQTRPVNLDAISNWRQKFPSLEPLYNAEELNCDIIHMDVSLQLMEIHVQNGADLLTRSEISIPSQDTERCEWQTVTSLIKPPELCRDHSVDSPWDANIAPTKIVSTSENETRLKVRFPAEEWAHIFPRLTDLQLKYEESQRSQAFGGESFQNMLPAQEFLHQISMHQEIQSRCVPGMPFIRRAMILWTFRAVLPGETPQTTWRYIDATPPHSCISPSSCSSNQPSADNFTTWGDGPSHLQHQDILDPYIHGLISPPSTAGLQSSFGTDDYGYYGRPFNMPPGNMGFGSVSPVDSESPMLDNDMAGSISAFLSNTADVRIDGYDYSPPDWSMSHSESSNPGSTWAGYAAVPSNTPYIEHESELESHSWPIAMDPRLVNWVESRDGKGGWTEMDAEKPKPVYIEQSDDNLMPWLNTANNEPKDIYVDADDVQLPSLSRGGLSPEPVDLKDPRWTRSDSSFDFNQLVECLGS